MNRTLRVLAGLLVIFASADTARADWIYVTPSQPRVIVRQPVFVSQHVVVSRPVFVSRPVIIERPVYVTQPVYVTEPVYVEPMCYEPVVISRPVVVSRPVVSHSWVGQPYAVREEVDVRRNKIEYEQKGRFQAFDGRRVKSYRYEYEVEQRPSGVRYKFDIDD